MQELAINLGDAQYSVVIDAGVIERLTQQLEAMAPNSSFYLICDEFVFENVINENDILTSELVVGRYVVPGQKNNKTFYSALKIFQHLDDLNISRDVVIVAIGGGVVGDLSGFIAGCWYRGVNLIHVPTTLLSAVDSCLGGKAALNFRNTVNAVGLYHHPVGIIIDPAMLSSLPAREIASGFGEIIKYYMLGCERIGELLAEKEEQEDALALLIAESLSMKESLVLGDVKEGSKRLFLNFGHTIGHAIEFSTVYEGKELLRHGEGVGLGMLAIMRICTNMGICSEAELEHLKKLLLDCDLPINFEASRLQTTRENLVEGILSLAFKDKKRTKNALRLVVLRGIGKPDLYPTTDKALIRIGIEEVIV